MLAAEDRPAGPERWKAAKAILGRRLLRYRCATTDPGGRASECAVWKTLAAIVTSR